MIKVLFLIHDLGQGGAEKVLVNLVNNMDPQKFDITVETLFDYGENRGFLGSNIKYRYWLPKVIPGNSKLMKFFSPKQLHKMIIKERYDIEIAYLEGPCARVISGCTDPQTKLCSWIHIIQSSAASASASFRSIAEAKACYSHYNRIISVSEAVRNSFLKALDVPAKHDVLYNTNESSKILSLSRDEVESEAFSYDGFRLVGVGKLLKSKGFDRILRIVKRLLDEHYPVCLYILGEGKERKALTRFARLSGIEKNLKLLGYQLNPYKYISKCDLFVCASHAEGFSTAATEALIVGTPVCTVDVSGMKEMLGENNEYGIVTENDDEALYRGIKKLLDDPALLAHYREKAKERGNHFSTEETVRAVEKMLTDICMENTDGTD